jgi:hypothetical protein
MIVLGHALAILGAILLYLASDNQRLLRRHAPRRVFAIAGFAAEVTSLVTLFQVFGPATAVFVWITITMTIWSIVPLMSVWYQKK